MGSGGRGGSRACGCCRINLRVESNRGDAAGKLHERPSCSTGDRVKWVKALRVDTHDLHFPSRRRVTQADARYAFSKKTGKGLTSSAVTRTTSAPMVFIMPP